MTPPHHPSHDSEFPHSHTPRRSDVEPIQTRLDALGAAERSACPPSVIDRVFSASSRHLPPPAPIRMRDHASPGARSRWLLGGAQNGWIARGRATAAAAGLALAAGAAWMALSTSPGPDGTSGSGRSTASVSSAGDDWLALDDIFDEPLGSGIEMLRAEAVLLEHEIETGPFDETWFQPEGAM